MKFKTHFVGYQPGLSPRGESITIQNQVLSIAEMFERMKNGIPLNFNTLEYPEQETDEQLRPRDLTDVDEYRERVEYANRIIENHKKLRNKLKTESESGQESTILS